MFESVISLIYLGITYKYYAAFERKEETNDHFVAVVREVACFSDELRENSTDKNVSM